MRTRTIECPSSPRFEAFIDLLHSTALSSFTNELRRKPRHDVAGRAAQISLALGAYHSGEACTIWGQSEN